VEKILRSVVPDATLVRGGEDRNWRRVAWDIAPTLDQPQLIRSDLISPIVHSDDGVLLGELNWGDTTVWVLSDPDVINNAGIDEGDNAVFAMAMITAQLPPGSSVIFDETIHGFALSPDLWKALLSFPLNLAVLQGLCAAAVLV